MHRNNIPPFDQSGTPARICVADGHGSKIRVDRRHLVVEDGFSRSRRERRFRKATTDLKRLIILGTTGYMSLEAVRWLADANIPTVHIDPEGQVLTTSQPMGSDRAALRRAQAWALTNETGLNVVRYLLDRKLEGKPTSHNSSVVAEMRLTETRASLKLLALSTNSSGSKPTPLTTTGIRGPMCRVGSSPNRNRPCLTIGCGSGGEGRRSTGPVRGVRPIRSMPSSTTCTPCWKPRL